MSHIEIILDLTIFLSIQIEDKYKDIYNNSHILLNQLN